MIYSPRQWETEEIVEGWPNDDVELFVIIMSSVRKNFSEHKVYAAHHTDHLKDKSYAFYREVETPTLRSLGFFGRSSMGRRSRQFGVRGVSPRAIIALFISAYLTT